MNQIVKKVTFAVFTLLFAASLYAQQAAAPTAKKNITLEDIWLNYTFYPASVEGLKSLNDGLHYTVDEEGDIVRYDYETGTNRQVIVSASELSAQGLGSDFFDYEFSQDEKKILLSSGREPIYRHSFRAANYVWDIEKKTLIKIGNEKQQLASFSPDGTKVAYVRTNNLYVFDIATKKENQLTFDGQFNKIINGAPDWVYEEEFSFSQGFQWSPDSKKIAFMRFDESNVKEFSMEIYGKLYPEQYKFKYPKAGEDNSLVTIHVYHLDKKGKKAITKIDIGTETDQYIPRIKWTNSGDFLCITRLNRLQNKLELLFANPYTGNSEVLYSEENKYYIDITDDMIFTKDNKYFSWTSEKDGYNHIYLFDIQNKKMKQVTSGGWDVVKIIGIDESKSVIYYLSAEGGPLGRDVYSIKYDGSAKNNLSPMPGTNEALFSSTFRYMILTHSDANTPPVTSLYSNEGELIRVLESNNELTKKLADYNISNVEFFKFKNSENILLNGWMIKPNNFDPTKKYPVFMTVYGGPGANTVSDEWSYSNLWYQLLAQKGYIVVSVDNRGTGYRGEAFKKCTYLQLGKLETADQIDAAKYLRALSFVDSNRIGIQGWSYGGFMATSCILKGADYFKMAIAVAPVTNWRNYDNIYTERFMRKPQENPLGYDDNSPVKYVKNLKGKLLIIHGSADDNVHYQNTMELAKALNDANKQFDMHIYPNKNHGIYGGMTRLHLFTMMTNYILKNL